MKVKTLAKAGSSLDCQDELRKLPIGSRIIHIGSNLSTAEIIRGKFGKVTARLLMSGRDVGLNDCSTVDQSDSNFSKMFTSKALIDMFIHKEGDGDQLVRDKVTRAIYSDHYFLHSVSFLGLTHDDEYIIEFDDSLGKRVVLESEDSYLYPAKSDTDHLGLKVRMPTRVDRLNLGDLSY